MVERFEARVSKIGNSLWVLIPNHIHKYKNIKPHDKVKVLLDAVREILSPDNKAYFPQLYYGLQRPHPF